MAPASRTSKGNQVGDTEHVTALLSVHTPAYVVALLLNY